MNLNPAEKNAFEALDMLLRMSKVRVTSRTVREKLWQHPDFPSLASLSDVLDELNVSNIATRLSPEQLPEIPLPALTHMEVEGGLFALVRTISADTVEWLHTSQGWQKQSMRDFSRIWNGVTLLIESNQQSGEVNYSERRRQEWIENSRYPFITVGLLVCFGFLLSYSFQQDSLVSNGQLYGLMGLKLTGSVISSLLIAYSLNADNPFLRSICQLSSRTNCNSILNSKAAKIVDWLSWSEVGLIYFLGGFIAIALSLIIPAISAVQMLVWLNLFTLPYTLYSIYYQTVIAKEFCILCTVIQLILWVEFFVGRTLSGAVFLGGIELMLFSFILISTLWVFIKKPLNLAGQMVPLHRELYKLKFNPEYVEGLVTKQRIMPPILNEMEVITLGNRTASNTLTIVTNPLCRPCAKTHREIEKLVENTDDVKCNVVFILHNRSAMQVAQKIMGLATENRANALRKWFEREDKNIEKWNVNLNASTNMDESDQQLTFHNRWCELARIKSTPTIFLNGTELPTLYHISDVVHLCKSPSLQKGFLSN